MTRTKRAPRTAVRTRDGWSDVGPDEKESRMEAGRITVSVRMLFPGEDWYGFINGSVLPNTTWPTLEDAQGGMELLAVSILEEAAKSIWRRIRPPAPRTPPEEPL
jgi:hypothetical protein